MELQPLSVKTRSNIGKGAARKIRAQELIPAVLYGNAEEPLHIVIDEHEFDHLVHTKGGEHSLIDLTIEDNPDLNCRAMIKDVQHHPVRGHFLHADLLRIDMNKKITTLTPIVLVGQAIGVVNGGVMDHQTREIEIECLPTNMPEKIEVDVTDLEIGHNIVLADINIPDDIAVLESEDRSIVAVHPPRVVKTAAEIEEEEAAAAEAAEGEEGENDTEGQDD